jgi:hypothetical protein
MDVKKLPKVAVPIETAGRQLPEYKPPTVVTFTDDELLEALGPAHAVSGCPNPFVDPLDPDCFV